MTQCKLIYKHLSALSELDHSGSHETLQKLHTDTMTNAVKGRERVYLNLDSSLALCKDYGRVGHQRVVHETAFIECCCVL